MQYFSPVHPRKLRIKPNQSVLLHSISYSDERRGGKKSADYKAKRKLTFLGQLTGSAAIRERVQALKHGSLDHLQFTVVCTGCGKKKGHKRNCAFHSSNLPNPPHSKTVSSPIPPIPSLPLSMTDPDVDSSCSSLDPLLSELKKIAKHVFEKKIQKFLLDSPSVTNTRKTNTSRPVPYPSYIYQFPDPTLEDNFTNEMFSSAEMLQYYSFLSTYADIFVWDPIRQSRHLLTHKIKQLQLLECPLGHELTFDGWNSQTDNIKWVFSLEGKLRFVFSPRLKCEICSKSTESEKPQSRFDCSSSFFVNRLPHFLIQKFPLALGNQRGCFSKEFLQAAHSLRVGAHTSVDSIHSVHRECVSNNLLSSSIICFSLLSHLLLGLKNFMLPLVNQSLVKNFKILKPVLWKRDHELAISPFRINKYIIRDLQSLEMLYIASLEAIQCKLLRYDHTFKVASMVQLIHRSSDSFNYHHSLPYSAVLTTMNEDQKVPFFSFVVSKSLSEVEDSLYSLTHRSPTVCIVGDNPNADSHFFQRILNKDIQFSRDIFHVFQDLFRECLPARQTERKSFMSELWFVFFSIHEPDIKYYKDFYFEKLAKENSEMPIDQKVQNWEVHRNSPSFFHCASESHRVRTVLNPSDEIINRLKSLIDKYNPNEEMTLFKPTIHSLHLSLVKQVRDGLFLPLSQTSGIPEFSNIGTESSPHWISNRSTSPLENYHQLIHHVLSGVSSPSVAHLILVAFTFRFNYTKENKLFYFSEKNTRPISYDPRLFNCLRDCIDSLENKQKPEESPCFPVPVYEEIAQYSLIPTTLDYIKSNPSLQVGIYRDKWRYSMARLAFESEDLSAEQLKSLSFFLEQNFPLSSPSSNVLDSYRSLSQKMNLTDLPIRSDFVSSPGERSLIRQLINEQRFLICSSSPSSFLKPADFLRKYDIYQLTMEFNLKILRSFSFHNGQIQTEDVQIPNRFVDSRVDSLSANNLITFPLKSFTLKEVEHIREFILIYADTLLRETNQQTKTNSVSVTEAKEKIVQVRKSMNLSSSEITTPAPLSRKRKQATSIDNSLSSTQVATALSQKKVNSQRINSASISSFSSVPSLAMLATIHSSSSLAVVSAIIPPSPVVASVSSSVVQNLPPSSSDSSVNLNECPCCKQVKHSKFKCAAFLLGHDENGNWTSAITRLNSGESKLQACYRHYSMLQAALLLAAGERNSSIIT